jgi:hypothetical protein
MVMPPEELSQQFVYDTVFKSDMTVRAASLPVCKKDLFLGGNDTIHTLLYMRLKFANFLNQL